MLVKCANCQKEFDCQEWRIQKRTNLFCSKNCENEYRKIHSVLKENLNAICGYCGKKFHLKESYLKKLKHQPCCSRDCLAKYRKIIYQGNNNPNFGNKGEKNPNWKSDRKITNYGYVKIRIEDHPFKDCDGFVFEHRLIAEKYLLTKDNSIIINGKKYLKKEYIVHHIDGNRTNNEVSNLKIMTLGEHTSFHRKFKNRRH